MFRIFASCVWLRSASIRKSLIRLYISVSFCVMRDDVSSCDPCVFSTGILYHFYPLSYDFNLYRVDDFNEKRKNPTNPQIKDTFAHNKVILSSFFEFNFKKALDF